MAQLGHFSFSSPAAVLINTQILISSALLSPPGILAAALGFNPGVAPCATGIPVLAPCPPLTHWLGTS